MRSLRGRLFVLLFSATLAVWSAAAVWTYFSTRADVQRVLDRRLVEAAGMVASLVQNSSGAISRPVAATVPSAAYSRQLSCQIWTLDWRLVGRSASAPAAPLAAGKTGFSERSIQGEQWRVYTLIEPNLGLRILVGDNLSVRRNLVGDVLTGLLLPALVALLALGLLIWSAIERGLVPIRRVARELSNRQAEETGPLRAACPDAELRPLIEAINGLFARLQTLRENERHFIASAAHELQTPLAGLKAHAQIALAAREAAVREQSLRSIQTSVDRTSRLVQQLLDLSREEAEAELAIARWMPLERAVVSVVEEISPMLGKRKVSVEIDKSAQSAEIYVDEGGLQLAVRNLISNAIEHSPAGSRVTVSASAGADWTDIVISDEGPGIPTGEVEHIRQRFVRGSRAKGPGSGLGLSIVELVLERAGATLHLRNAADRGLRAVMRFPSRSVRFHGEGQFSEQPRSSNHLARDEVASDGDFAP